MYIYHSYYYFRSFKTFSNNNFQNFNKHTIHSTIIKNQLQGFCIKKHPKIYLKGETDACLIFGKKVKTYLAVF